MPSAGAKIVIKYWNTLQTKLANFAINWQTILFFQRGKFLITSIANMLAPREDCDKCEPTCDLPAVSSVQVTPRRV